VYAGFGLRTVLAPPDVQPRVSRDEAIEKAKGPPADVGEAKGPIEADLVLLSDGDWSPGARGSRSTTTDSRG
jgi:hypothetical protein